MQLQGKYSIIVGGQTYVGYFDDVIQSVAGVGAFYIFDLAMKIDEHSS
jgi:hypothetical protein